MAVANVSWEAQDGTAHTLPARFEDMSHSGACIRVRIPLDVGSRIHVTWCRGKISGVTKYCRADNGEYLVGMQRDKNASPSTFAIPSRADNPGVRRVDAPVVQAPTPPKIQCVPTQQQTIRREVLAPIPEPAPLPLVPVTFPPAVVHNPLIGFEIASDNSPRKATPRERRAAPSAKYQNGTSPLFEERTNMQPKWLNLGSRRQQQDAPKGNANGAPSPRSAVQTEDVPASSSPSVAGDATLATPRGDLLPLDDIYRSAGIVAPRMGYSITKVVEMLGSDHLRGLSDDVKRASVLMALHAAGIPLADILQDAAQRQSAVASYEAEQRGKFEEYWSRRAEENSLLQAEMERVTRQYVERMNRNLNEVAQEKEAFQKWQAAMQQEVQRISEAVTLCAQPAVVESSADQPAASAGQTAVAKSA